MNDKMCIKGCGRVVPPSDSTGHCCNHCARGWGHTVWCERREKPSDQEMARNVPTCPEDPEGTVTPTPERAARTDSYGHTEYPADAEGNRYPDPHYDEDDGCSCPDHIAMRYARNDTLRPFGENMFSRLFGRW